MSYFTPDVIAREQLFGTEAAPSVAEAVAEAIIGVFPPRLRRRVTALIPMVVTMRRPFTSVASMSRLIRTPLNAVFQVERLVRRRFTESFTQKRLVINKEFKRLLRTVKEYMLEE